MTRNPPARILSGMPAVAIWFLLMLAAIGGSHALPAEAVGDGLIRNTVRVSLLFWLWAVTAMLRTPAEEWTSAARMPWTLAWAAYVVHLYMAFECFHDWSHDHAVAHVQARSGFGPGIWFSHLFTAAWTADVLWWALAPASYLRRPAWVGRTLHGFLAFITFNGTVVYEEGFARWAGVAMTLWLAWLLWSRRRGAGLGRFRTV